LKNDRHGGASAVTLIPMTELPNLIETSFAEAITIIAAAHELPEQTRRHWITSLRRIAKALDKPLEVIAARFREMMASARSQQSHAPVMAAVTAQRTQGRWHRERRRGNPASPYMLFSRKMSARDRDRSMRLGPGAQRLGGCKLANIVKDC
jgi:hypothetical protein